MPPSDRYSSQPEPATSQHWSEMSIDLDPLPSSLSGDLLNPLPADLQPDAKSLLNQDEPVTTVHPQFDQPGITSRDLALKYCQWGDKSFAAQEYEQAKSAYHIAIKWDHQLATVYGKLAQTYDRLQDYQSAFGNVD